jgi:carbonic anhydrase
VSQGQHPKTLFIGCSDSCLAPCLLTGAGPGALFIVRNVGAFISPCGGTTAAIEFAVLSLKVERIVVCGHSQCVGIRAPYESVPHEAAPLKTWLKLVQEALLPVQPRPEAIRHTEQRSVVLQLERLMGHPMVRSAVEAEMLNLHGWHFVIEEGEICIFDAQKDGFVPASLASHCGTGPYALYVEHDGQVNEN